MRAAGDAEPLPGAGRYAPSPTGPLHLGNLRTAVLAWLFARSSGRRFLLRMEDLDRHRVRPGDAARQEHDLAALGITFDDSRVVQSERFERYDEALAQLRDVTYECFCTRREIAEAASAPHGGLRHYRGTCRQLSESQRSERRLTRSPALRLAADGAAHTVTDELHGEVTGLVEDVVLRRNDGVAAYQLAVVVDDGAMGVDQVVRGDDLLSSAPAQGYLAGLLGVPEPTYAHVPLAVNPAGARLAKRDGAVTLSDLAVRGIGASQALSLIAASLGMAAAGEPVSLSGLLARFDPAGLPRVPWVVNPLSSLQWPDDRAV